MKLSEFASLKSKVAELFGADLRSLAALRIGVASIIVLDLVQRAGDLTAHYSDFGVAPRAAVIEGTTSRWLISLHFMSGVWEVQALLFLAAGIFALAMLVGYRTRLVTVVSWVLLISVQTRNPFIIGGGDIMLRVVFFWCMFLPWGACCSVDSAWAESLTGDPRRCLSLGTVAYSVQILFVYWFTAILKSGPEWHGDGSALYYAFSADEVVTSAGHFLLQFPLLLKLLTHGVLLFEFVGPVLLFSPLLTDRLRLAAVFGFWLLHLGILSTLRVGIFPVVGIVSILFFVPSCAWDELSRLLRREKNLNLKIYYDGECGFCSRSVRLLKTFLLFPHVLLARGEDELSVLADIKQHNSWVVIDAAGVRHFGYDGVLVIAASSPFLAPLLPILNLSLIRRIGENLYSFVANHRKIACVVDPMAHSNRRLSANLSFMANVGIVILVTYLLVWNLDTVPNLQIQLSERFKSVGYLLRLDQHWQMFAPFPAKDDGWFVIPGRLSDGTAIDLFTGRPAINWKKPESISATFKNHRWRKYMELVWKKGGQRNNFAHYLCRSWNASHDSVHQLIELEIVFMLEWTLPNYEYSTPEKISLLKFRCPKS